MFRITKPSTPIQMGRAAEFLVCFDLLRHGLDAYVVPSPESPYDVVLEIGDRLVKIQVKSTFAVNTRNAKKHTLADGTSRQYKVSHFRFVRGPGADYSAIDGYAFVVLSESLIRYYGVKDVPWASHSKFFNPEKFRQDTESFEKFIRGLRLGL